MFNKIENYIFDLDGTILNSLVEVLRCCELAFLRANIEIDKSKLTSDIIGPPLRDILISINPKIKSDKQLVETINDYFREIYDNIDHEKSVMYDGMENLIKTLKQNKKRLFIATLKPTIPTLKILKSKNLLEYFTDIYTIDKDNKSFNKKEMVKDIISKYGLNCKETIMIGDAPSDMIAAKENNIVGIGALWGYGKNKQPLKDLATLTVNNAEELKYQILNLQTTP